MYLYYHDFFKSIRKDIAPYVLIIKYKIFFKFAKINYTFETHCHNRVHV